MWTDDPTTEYEYDTTTDTTVPAGMFAAHELAHLAFIRWLVQTGRLTGDTEKG